MQTLFVALALILSPFSILSATGAELLFTTQDFEPFTYGVDRKVAGPATDIVRAVCEESQIHCSFRLLPWSRAQKEVAEGKAEGMYVIGWNEQRAETLYFSPPLLKTEYGFFVRTDNPLIFKQSSDLKGYRVGVYGPSNTSVALEKIRDEIGDLTIDMRPDDESGFKKLALGRVDAVFSNRDVGLAMIKKYGISNLRYAGSFSTLNYYVGFSKRFADKALVERFSSAFKKLHAQGVIHKILQNNGLEAARLD